MQPSVPLYYSTNHTPTTDRLLLENTPITVKIYTYTYTSECKTAITGKHPQLNDGQLYYMTTSNETIGCYAEKKQMPYYPLSSGIDQLFKADNPSGKKNKN
jgi:hypothetical protein